MAVLIVVPARYASTRYPGKPLVALTGARGESRTLIERSWAYDPVDRPSVSTHIKFFEEFIHDSRRM